MFARACLAEECVESIITATNGFVAGHLAIWLNAVLEAEKLPARISNLNASLAEMKAENLAHAFKEGEGEPGMLERRAQG